MQLRARYFGVKECLQDTIVNVISKLLLVVFHKIAVLEFLERVTKDRITILGFQSVISEMAKLLGHKMPILQKIVVILRYHWEEVGK